MANSSPLGTLTDNWLTYLRLREHQAWRHLRDPSILRSRNTRTNYRWLFLFAERGQRRLTPIEQERIKRQLRLGRAAGEQVFVVVKFERPEPKVVVLPAASLTKSRTVRADKGGIPWDW